jgi:aryl-alcohol dehydrogenase-like predicted oxidoreductase
MTFGPTTWEMPTCDEATAFKIMDRFAELGGNFIDTADIYGPHNSENIVGNWLQKTGRRDDFIVATKFTVPYGQGPNQCGASRKNILFSVEGSLKRLKTHYIDLYYVHL